MKKVLLGLSAAILVMVSCSTPGEKTTTEEKKPAPKEVPAQLVAGAKGEALIANSDCKTCHAKDTKLVGPSFKDIAGKYPAGEDNINMLADKVVSGGTGVWGSVPMAAHPGLNKDDAKEMVKYILMAGN